MKPLCIDLFCGLGGWTEGFIAEGYDVIGFDIERHDYGTGGYPGQLVLQDVLTLHGSQFRDAAVIVASPPCQEYSYMAMPWTRAKRIAEEYRSGVRSIEELNALFKACFRIADEAGVPLIVENVRGAQPWVGRANWNYGSYYLWGDVPALMPFTFNSYKSTGMNWSDRSKRGQDFTRIAGRKGEGSGRLWFYQNGGNKRSASSGSLERQMWSAQIAKIPFPLARHIAKCFKLEVREMVEV